MNDFGTVAADLLGRAETLLRDWLSAGKLRGHEYVVGDLLNNPGTSLSINVKTGAWSDFATGAVGGDLISLYAAINNLSQIDALKELSAPSLRPIKQIQKKPDLKQVIPAPHIPPIPSHPRHGQPSDTWLYHTAENGFIGYIFRYDTPEGKQIAPYSCWRDDSGNESWQWKSFEKPRPLYNLAELSERHGDPVLLVEGEKCAVIAKKHISGMVATTWSGGAQAYKYTDFSPLAQRTVTIWPDADAPGLTVANEIAALLTKIGCIVKIINPEGKSNGWDIADCVAEGINPLSWAKPLAALWVPSIASTPLVPAIVPKTAVTVVSDADEPDLDAPFAILGHDKGTYYFHARGSQQISDVTRAQFSKTYLLTLAPLNWWEMNYPGSKGGINLDMAFNALIQRAHKNGIFNPEKIRGRGAWFDEGRCVLNLGDRVIIDKQTYNPAAVPSKFIYEAGYPLTADLTTPLDAANAVRFTSMVEMLPLEKKIHAKFITGWVVCAMIGGILNWRPHLWLVGKKGSGKSYTMTNIIQKMLGENSLFVVGASTEAGIRQTLGVDSIPVIFDEAEGNNTQDIMRLQSILNLVRQSSSETGGKILKGTTGGDALNYKIRSCFAFSSINASLMQESDKSRVTVIEISLEYSKFSFDEIKSAERELFANNFADRLYSRVLQLAPIIRKNAVTFADAAAVVLGEQRAGDQVGALLAGAYALNSGKEIDYEKAKAWIDEQDFTAEREDVKTQSDEDNLLQYLFSQNVRVTAKNGQHNDTKIAVLIDIVSNNDHDHPLFHVAAANNALLLMGFKIKDGWLTISNNSNDIKKALQNTPWSINYSRVLKRLQGAEATGTVYFGYPRSESRAVRIPLGILKFDGE